MSIFIKPFIKRFFLITSTGAQGFVHSNPCLPTGHMTPCYTLKSTRSSQKAAKTRGSEKKKNRKEASLRTKQA